MTTNRWQTKRARLRCQKKSFRSQRAKYARHLHFPPLMTDERNPDDDADLGGDYARDTHRGGLGDDYARERGQDDAPERSKVEDDPHVGKASE